MKLAKILMIVVIGVTPRLTLQQMSALWKVGLYKMPDFGKDAAHWGESTTPISRGLLNRGLLVPFAVHWYFDGSSWGDVEVITRFKIRDGKLQPKSQQVISDVTTTSTPQPIPLKWPVVVEPVVEPVDPNVLLLQAKTISEKDPNDFAILKLVELLKNETILLE